MFLTPEKLRSIKFSDIKGKIVVSTIHTAPIGEISKTDGRISINRTYSNGMNVTGTSFNSSEYVKISLAIVFDRTAPTASNGGRLPARVAAVVTAGGKPEPGSQVAGSGTP